MVTYSFLAIWELQTTVRHKPNEVFAGKKTVHFASRRSSLLLQIWFSLCDTWCERPM